MLKLTTFPKKLAVVSLTIASLFLITPASAGHHNKSHKADIVDTAASSNNFSTLLAAVKAAGLVDTLKGNGPYTVFAPTNDAFAKLPNGTVENLLKPENRRTLVEILTYHVVPGKVLAKDVVKLNKAKTVQGDSIVINVVGNNVLVDNANVIKTDVTTSNGVIHVIDSVIMPGT